MSDCNCPKCTGTEAPGFIGSCDDDERWMRWATERIEDHGERLRDLETEVARLRSLVGAGHGR